MNRREFICCSALAAAGRLPGKIFSDESYSVSVLGDLHYDQPPIDTFHSEFHRKNDKNGYFKRYRREFESFASMWGSEGRCRVSPAEPRSAVVDALYDEYVPGIRRYFSADAAGHVRLRISDRAVLAEYVPLGSPTPERTFVLRER